MKNEDYYFTHKGESYVVEWEEENKILKLKYLKQGVEIGTRDIPLLGAIDQCQLDQIIKDYWKSFVKNVLKDIEI